MVYDGGKLRSSLVSVLISSISGMRVIELLDIIGLLGVGSSSSLLSGSFCVALVLHYFLVKRNHCHGETE